MKSILILSLFLLFFSCNDDKDNGNSDKPTNGGFDQQVIKTELTNDLWCTDVEIDICDGQGENCEVIIEVLQLDLMETNEYTFTYVNYPDSQSSGTWSIDDDNLFTISSADGDITALLRMNSLSEFDLLDPSSGQVALRFNECNDVIIEADVFRESLLKDSPILHLLDSL